MAFPTLLAFMVEPSSVNTSFVSHDQITSLFVTFLGSNLRVTISFKSLTLLTISFTSFDATLNLDGKTFNSLLHPHNKIATTGIKNIICLNLSINRFIFIILCLKS